MGVIDIRRFSVAWGVTAALLYFGCAVVMSTVDREAQILFFNSLLHGIDVAPILRTGLSLWEMMLGLVETFVVAWLTGATIAVIYNTSAPRRV